MRFFSFSKSNYDYTPIEVEVSLVPGVPRFQFLGLPDSVIKESELRIKSALRHSDYSLPKGQQILVNLKPIGIRKKSEGLDLAIALAFLFKSGQWQVPDTVTGSIYAYGELTLEGGVHLPEDFQIEKQVEGSLFLGRKEQSLNQPFYQVSSLRRLDELVVVPESNVQVQFARPPLPDISFSKEGARLLSIVSLGEHSVLLAGSAGSGKTTMAETIHLLREDPDEKLFQQSHRWGRRMGFQVGWRPFVAPHHTTPQLSMVGGGAPIFPGEITRAHGGTLFLDEFLEFKSASREALREPMEKKQITVVRQGKRQKFPADFLFVATTNLCPCGDFTPDKPVSCRFSLTRCRSYLDKLSGPIADRFQVMSFVKGWSLADDSVSCSEILANVRSAQKFRRQRGQTGPNGQLNLQDIEVSDFIKSELFGEGGSVSHRRINSTLRVARTIADLEESEKIKPHHIGEAESYTTFPFEKLKRAFV